jgi:hypothetical protein
MTGPRHAHPALAPDSTALVCADSRCGTLLASDAEMCDECGGTRLEPLEQMQALLCGWAGERAVVFKLVPGKAALIGRSSSTGRGPDIDLRRFPGSSSVHRRHVWIEGDAHGWRVTQLGTNRLVVHGRSHEVLRADMAAEIRHGDTLDIAGVQLTLVLRPSI